jgi:hypothetical protein
MPQPNKSRRAPKRNNNRKNNHSKTKSSSSKNKPRKNPSRPSFYPNQSKSAVATGEMPSISVGPAPDHPPPATSYGETWVMRTYQSSKTATSATGGVTFGSSDFGLSASDTFFLDKVQIWRLTNTATSSGIAGFFYQQNSTDLGGDVVIARDYGTATSLAGMTFKLPLGHAKSISAGSTSSAVSIVDCNPAYGVELATYCCQIHCWISI